MRYESRGPDVDTGTTRREEATLRGTRSGRCGSGQGSCPLADVSLPRGIMRSARHDIPLAIACAGVRLTYKSLATKGRYKSVEVSTSLSAPWRNESSPPGQS